MFPAAGEHGEHASTTPSARRTGIFAGRAIVNGSGIGKGVNVCEQQQGGGSESRRVVEVGIARPFREDACTVTVRGARCRLARHTGNVTPGTQDFPSVPL